MLYQKEGLIGRKRNSCYAHRSLLSVAIALLFTATSSCSGQSQQSSEKSGTAIERIENGLTRKLRFAGEEVQTFNINERLRQLGIPGISIAVAKDGKLEWAKAYGKADIFTEQAMTVNTLLQAGSISKPIAALQALYMVDKGELALDVDVNHYLKSWKLEKNQFTRQEKVTLRRILNHTAGLTVWGFGGYYRGSKIPTTEEVLNGSGNSPKVQVYKEPGQSWQYSGGGYVLMQQLIADVIDAPFSEAIQRNILEPLGMNNSTFENPLPDRLLSNAATGYRENGNEVAGKAFVYPELAAAGLWTTPSDLIQYALEIQRIYTQKEDGLLTYATISEMLRPGMNGHGLGPMINDETFFHDGDNQGFKSRLVAWKDGSYAIAIMVNSDKSAIMDEVLLAIANEYEIPGIAPTVIEPLDFTKEQLKKYEGTYQVQNMGNVQLKIMNGQLALVAPFLPKPLKLVAASDSVFYEKADGLKFNFSFENDQVTEFSVQDLLTATRVGK